MTSDPRLVAIAEREAEERRLRLLRLLDRYLEPHPEVEMERVAKEHEAHDDSSKAT
jgi:hypothetical protein